ncbi:MAG: LysM peptidoglycan-binding domain-containing C40 family peptidase [bacterium]|nr:LysM peptidoglycan-binding domain-containing C40 family peptidase [bacterium]
MRIGKLAAAAIALWLWAAPANADVVYSVRDGDNLEKISRKHGVSADKILEANPKIKGHELKEGFILIIPSQKEENDVVAIDEPPAPKVIDIDAHMREINRAGDRHRSAQLASRGALTKARALLSSAQRYLGTPYSMGATGNGAFDCSGFVMRIFQMHGISLPRTADVQYNVGRKVARGDEMPGDLVFFETYLPGPSHVGIYIGGGQFIHASSSRGVTISSLGQAYYASRYLGAKRLF